MNTFSRASRRQFLRLMGGAAAAFLLPSSVKILAAGAPRKRVIVIGAGLAGLTAAYELTTRGHDVQVHEARPQAGGRVHTFRHPFDDHLYAEAGGEWIHPAHRCILHYVRHFGLELQPDEGDAALWDGSTLLPFEEAEEAIAGLGELRGKLEEHAQEVDVFERPDRSRRAALDQLSYFDFLRKLGASDRAIAHERSLVSSLMTVDLSQISALHMLYESALPQPGAVESRVRGGNSLLVAAFAQALGSRLHLLSPAATIRWDAGGVEVLYRKGNTKHRESAEHVVVAIPATQVRRLRFDPPLPEETGNAYAALGYGRVMKVVLQARKRFWEAQPPVYQEVFTEGPVPHLYHSSRGQPGPRGLLTFYASAAGADQWGPLDSQERIGAARALLEEIWPTGPEEIERGTSWYWNVQQWIGGSYAYFAPGQMTGVRPFLPQPVGPIHFAGEHTAVWQGYMNGAVESGLRAAAETEPAVGELLDKLTTPAHPRSRLVRSSLVA